MTSKTPIIVLDTDVLMKAAVCKLILASANPAAFRVCWPERVEKSALRHTLNKRSERLHEVLEGNLRLVDDRIIDQADHLANQFPNTDDEDVHVATAAAGINAEMLVTGNIKDFDRQELQACGVKLFSIEDFGLWAIGNHLKRILRTFDRNPPDRLEKFLCTLEGDMPQTVAKLRLYLAEELDEVNPTLPFDRSHRGPQ